MEQQVISVRAHQSLLVLAGSLHYAVALASTILFSQQLPVMSVICMATAVAKARKTSQTGSSRPRQHCSQTVPRQCRRCSRYAPLPAQVWQGQPRLPERSPPAVCGSWRGNRQGSCGSCGEHNDHQAQKERCNNTRPRWNWLSPTFSQLQARRLLRVTQIKGR